MGHRLSKIYTKTGDDGTTGLGDGSRIAKSDLRVETYGTVDELNSFIGLIRAQLRVELKLAEVKAIKHPYDIALANVQNELFDLGGELSIPAFQVTKASSVTRLEESIDQLNETLPPLQNFVLPMGSLATCHIHCARTICRRAERLLATLSARDKNVPEVSLHYLNRLSDWLFVFARTLARHNGGTEVLWQSPSSS